MIVRYVAEALPCHNPSSHFEDDLLSRVTGSVMFSQDGGVSMKGQLAMDNYNAYAANIADNHLDLTASA